MQKNDKRRTHLKVAISIRRTVNLGVAGFPGQTLVNQPLQNGHL